MKFKIMNNSKGKTNISLTYDLAHSNRTSSKISSIVTSDKDQIESANYSYFTQTEIIKICNVTNNNITRKAYI